VPSPDTFETAPTDVLCGSQPAPEADIVPYPVNTLDTTPYFEYESSRALVEYCLGAGIHDVVYLDRSARNVYAGVSEYQKLAMPELPRLGTYFLNPDTVKWREGMDLDEHARDIEEKLLAVRSALLGKKEESLLLFDICAHSGDSLGNTHRTLQRIGFSAMKLGVLTDNTATRANANITLDFRFTTHEQPIDCQAFGRDERLVKTLGGIFVGRDSSQPARAIFAQRELIRAQVRAGYAADTRQTS
jgi:hypothetical protein